MDEQGLDPAAFQRPTQALERHKVSSTTRVHHCPLQPEPGHTMNSYTSELPIFERYAEQKILPHGSSVSALLHLYAPGHYIDDTERVGLPETSDPFNIAGEQAEKVVVTNVRKRRLGEKLKFGKRREKTKRMSDGGREFNDNQDAGTEPAQIARQRSLVGPSLTI
ncbi:hypothetical protein H2248_002230 [Termitomyces sp. 'cryptogamus']|nr:hypothetical protein H2248_002230 [Termitomyces sp. 'cryptogamus']